MIKKCKNQFLTIIEVIKENKRQECLIDLVMKREKIKLRKYYINHIN